MMTKLCTNPAYRLLNLLLVWYLLSGCLAVSYPAASAPISPIQQGEVATLFKGTASYIIDSVLAGEVGSMIWISPDSKLVVYSRPLFDGVAWVCARAKTDMSYAGGNLANYETWQQLKDWMTAQGWQVINASLASAKFAIESLRLIEMSLPAITLIPVDCAYPELFYLTGSCDAPADET